MYAAVSGWATREGRPRNLGRGVSKPKKNTVASLLAQSRALGLRPALAHQLLAETDLVNNTYITFTNRKLVNKALVQILMDGSKL